MKIEDLEAYELLETKQLEDFKSVGYLLRHKKSGARISAISNDDENKVFYIGFRTPPEDSTGVAHIIEHTVLCGSLKFPAKDPFVELVKGSLNTFLNAMTYPDKTVYPVASCNEKDFQNLMDVYMDAVLHPNIYKREEIFKQEGWHYELEGEDAPITLNGVVYNEMKGAFSSPEDVLEREILNSLFPDTAYGVESGGDPAYIPDLTYEAYLDFHRKYYHPSNSYIYLYGNMDLAKKLEWMDREYLSSYEKKAVDSKIQLQKPFEKPVEIRKEYPVSSTETVEDNTYLSYNMVIGNALDKELYQAFEILDYALLSAPGAPLKQALLDAGIGKDIMGGYENGICQPTFSIIVKNSNAKKKEEFLSIIKRVLKEQAEGGLNKKALLAGLYSAEFRYREADFGSYPKGLIYGLQCLDSWLYDEEKPFWHLEASETFQFLKEQSATDYFENLIRTYMLDNPHVSVVMIEPKQGLNAENDRKLEEKLGTYKDSLSQEEIKALIRDTKHLKEYQEAPSTKEDLEKIPMLKREDMKKEMPGLINELRDAGGTKILFHEIFTNRICYLNFLFDVRMLKKEDLPYLGILKGVLGYTDTESHTYSDLANEMNLNMGGFSSAVVTYANVKDTQAYEAKFEVHIKVLYEKIQEAAGLLEEILCQSKLSDEKRLKEILSEMKSRLQMNLSSYGNSASAMRAMSYFSETAYISDATNGIAFYRVVADYEEHFQEKKQKLVNKLKEVLTTIFTKQGMMVSLTCDEEGFKAAKPAIQRFRQALPDQQVRELQRYECRKANEGFMGASKVQYVSRAGNFISHGYSYTGALKILKVILSYDYLWVQIRVKGGAYGCMSGFLRNGNTYFSSFRDPNLSKTNEVYEGIPKYLSSFQAQERDMTKYIIGTISDLDTPLNPSAKGTRSLSAYLCNISYDMLQRERDEVLSAQPEDIRALEGLIRCVLEEGNLCVIGNEEMIKEEKGLFSAIEQLY